MIGRITAIFLVELSKAVRLKFTYIGPLLVVLVVLCVPLMDKIERDDISDYGFIAKATPMAVNLVGLLILLVYCAGLMASELNSGSIQMALIRPIRRHEFFLAKLLLGMTYAVLLTVLAAATSWLLVLVFGDASGVSFGGEVQVTSSQMAGTYVIALLLDLFPQFAAVAFALMISTLTTSPSAAIGTTIGIWVSLDAIKYSIQIDRLLFSSYLEMPWQVFADYCDALDASWFPEAYWLVGTSVLTFTICVAVAIFSLSRRNLCL